MAVYVKDGVQFGKIAPKGFEILSAIHRVSDILMKDLTITSATDGRHSSPGPHERGEAFDLRSKDLDGKWKQTVCAYLEQTLGPDFLVLLEDFRGVNEHIHIQPRPKPPR